MARPVQDRPRPGLTLQPLEDDAVEPDPSDVSSMQVEEASAMQVTSEELEPDTGLPGRLGLDIGLDVLSRYVYRGVVRVENAVTQMYGTLIVPDGDTCRLKVTVWGNYNLTDDTGKSLGFDGNQFELTESRLYVRYERDFGHWRTHLGLLNYNFPNSTRPSTSEVFGGLGWRWFEVEAYYDFDSIEGWYVSGAAEGYVPLTDRLRLTGRLNVGWMDENLAMQNFGVDESGIADITGSGHLNWAFSDHGSLNVGLYASTIGADRLTTRLEGAGIPLDNFWGSIGVSWSF